MTLWPVHTCKTYFIFIRENLANNFSNIKISQIFIVVYRTTFSVYSVYTFLEICFLKMNLPHLLDFRLFITHFFIAKLKFLFFLFYYCYFYLILQLKIFLMQNNFVSLTSSLVETQKRFLVFCINLQLKFISFEFQLSNFYMKLSNNNIFVAIIFGLTTLTLLIRLYFLVVRFLRLKKIVLFYLKKNKKQKLEQKLKVKASISPKNLQHISYILIDLSYFFVCSQIFVSFLLCFYKFHKNELLLLKGG